MPEETLSLRLSGDQAGIGAMLAVLRAMPDVDGLLELGLDVPGRSDDSSSLGLPSEEGKSDVQDVQLRIPNSVAYDHVHGRIEMLAAGAGVVVEWLDGE